MESGLCGENVLVMILHGMLPKLLKLLEVTLGSLPNSPAKTSSVDYSRTSTMVNCQFTLYKDHFAHISSDCNGWGVDH